MQRTFLKKSSLHSQKTSTIGVAELYKAKVAGQSPAALIAPATADKSRKMSELIFLLLSKRWLLPFRYLCPF
ncbi:MAG: hypothetical protein E7647_04425 [Ruminococcaceae bacterium]|nr:hypothetical protein [Oscillospiraceae bacterium]